MNDCPVNGWDCVEDNSDFKADPLPEIEDDDTDEDDEE